MDAVRVCVVDWFNEAFGIRNPEIFNFVRGIQAYLFDQSESCESNFLRGRKGRIEDEYEKQRGTHKQHAITVIVE